MTGTLYLVATPIGNLGDMSFRAVETLKQVDLIACEDTRHTQKLLNHYSISNKLISYHEHNEASRADELVARMTEGKSVAVVTTDRSAEAVRCSGEKRTDVLTKTGDFDGEATLARDVEVFVFPIHLDAGLPVEGHIAFSSDNFHPFRRTGAEMK